MRHKIRKMLNKEEGFTLVELLAVIVILGIIVAIAIPAIGSVIDRAEGDAKDAEIAMVEDAARLYVTAERDSSNLVWNSPGFENTVTIPISTSGASLTTSLYDAGYLEDRAGEERLKGTVMVTRKPIDGQVNSYTYEYTVNLD